MKILLFVLIVSCNILAQISPGDLTSFHANLEGLSNCTKCHEIGEKVLSSKCLDCHSEIKNLIEAKRGYHSSSEVQKKECFSCHSEHHGRNFRIINFQPESFDHNKSGFKLEGAHLKKDCKDCHQSKFISDPNIKKRKNTYLGLSQNCLSCHEDKHENTLGSNCSGCHSMDKFKPASKFDHNNAKFKLTGAHITIDCAKCHPVELKNGKEFQKFKGSNFSNCAPCHQDVHKGSFGVDCKSCHTSTSSFKIINQASFDHSKTKFPLVGKHALVSCNKCHTGGITKKLSFANCTDCHTDYHKGEFVENGKTKDCKSCHTESGFSPSIFTIEEHNKTKFTLTGSHLAVPCIQCHKREVESWSFKMLKTQCIDCHNNVHGEEISEQFLPEKKCEKCHSTENWNTITFDHDRTEFELSGKHKSVSCGECHYRDYLSTKAFKFKTLTSNCEQCHRDIHFGQFKEDLSSNCEQCHGFDNWQPVKFNHDTTRFPIDGAHKKIECSKCHPTKNENGYNYKLFKVEDYKCAFCHSK